MPSTTLKSDSDLKRAFVSTYDHPSYDDPWGVVDDYERVQRYSASHPQQGSHVVSKALDLPRGRIRSWVDGEGMPDCYRGLQTALSKKWIGTGWNGEPRQALNCLAAWILSSGSINNEWVPTFVADTDEEIQALRRYASSAGVRIDRTRERGDRPTEWQPTADASVLGRVLYTWTGVKGHKKIDSISFPAYLETAPEHVTSAFLKVYVQQRGTVRSDRDGEVQLMAKRSEGFRTALKRALQGVVDDPKDIRGEAWPLRIRGDAIGTLRQYPQIVSK